MKSTKLIKNESGNKRSRLIKAWQLLNNETYPFQPEGTWDSKAKITIFTKNDVLTISSSNFDVEFAIPFDDNLEANEGEVIIYNLDDYTLGQIPHKCKIVIEAGYRDDTGVIFNGYVVKKSSPWEGADRVTTLRVIDDIEKESVNKSFDAGTSSKTILEDLIGCVNRPIKYKDIAYWVIYENGVTIDNTLEAALRQYSNECNVSTFLSKGNLYCCSLDRLPIDVSPIITVSSETGLLSWEEVPELDEDYN